MPDGLSADGLLQTGGELISLDEVVADGTPKELELLRSGLLCCDRLRHGAVSFQASRRVDGREAGRRERENSLST
jgi:hypothetical protein